jgi:hypothetical protein
MEKNVGGLDEGIRITLGPLLVVLSIASLRGAVRRKPALALAGLAVGGILTATGLTKTCPANSALGRNTRQTTEMTEEAREVRERALQ